jgi:ApaG protein
MVGHYTMRNGRGEVFDIAIPAFSLDLPGTRRTVN